MTLHPIRQTATDVAISTGGLLPRLLTFTRRNFSEGGLPHLALLQQEVIFFPVTVTSRLPLSREYGVL